MSDAREEDSRSRRRAWGIFAIVAIASIGLISAVDDRVWAIAMRIAPSLAFLGRDRIASLVVCAILCRAVGGAGAFRLPGRGQAWRFPATVAGCWLAGTVVAVLVLKVWTVTLRDRDDYIAFLGTGLLAEELLFRGAVYAAASRAAPDLRSSRVGPAVWLSAGAFAIAHLQYHGFRMTSGAVTQVLYALPMGLVFGVVRKHTGSLWPAVVVHVVNNCVSVVRLLWLP